MNEKEKNDFFNQITQKKSSTNIKFTGERFVPGYPELIHLYQEHIIRYLFASQFTKKKTVLDAGCGTGYGSFFIAKNGARKVIGIDISDEAITYSKNNFSAANIEFQKGDCCKTGFPDSSFDVIIAFELIEHLEQYEDFIKEMGKILKKDGIIILSTPNKLTYNSVNPFHFHEFTENELNELLSKNFEHVSIFYQTTPSALAISRNSDEIPLQELDIKSGSQKSENAQYLIAVCSNSKIAKIDSKLFLFNEDTLFTKNFPLLQKNVVHMQNELATKDALFTNLTKEYQERTNWALQLEQEVKQKVDLITKLEEERKKNQEILLILEIEIKNLRQELMAESFELNTIKTSFIFKQAKKIATLIDKIIPYDSSRREFARLVSESIRIMRVYGLKAFFQSARAKINSTRLANKSFKKKIPAVTPQNEFTVDSSKLIIHEDSDKIIPDQTLRKFLQFGFYDVTNLQRKPLVSIIIPTYNAIDLLKSAIQSIENFSTYANYEIIIVTNNLDVNSPMRKFLETLKHKVYVFDKEYSFSAVNNFAAAKAQGEFLLFLNDDTRIVSKNWMESLLKLGLEKDVGAVGGKILFPNGRLQEAGCIVWSDGNAWNYGRNSDPTLPEFNFVRDVDYCSASCLLVRKDVFLQVGGFDTNYTIAYGEDADLCLAIKKAGYRILYQPLATIIHYEGKTLGSNANSAIKSQQLKNQKLFYQKWKGEIQQNMIGSKENTHAASNRRKGMDILYVDHYVPQIDKDAGSQNAFYTVSILSYLGHKVVFWPENLNESQPYTTELQQRGIEVMYGYSSLTKFLKERGQTLSIAILCRPHIAINFIDSIKKYCPNCKIIYEASDLYHIGLERESSADGKDEKRLLIEKTKETELSLMKKSNLVIFRTVQDCQIAVQNNYATKVAAIHIPPLYNGQVNPYETRKDIVFVGGFKHPPNSDAVEYFINDVFHFIQEKLPDVKFHIIGSNMPDKIIQLCNKTKNCVSVGYVEDLSSMLNSFRVMIVPLRYGSGIKGKVTESLSHCLPVVTTSIGGEGLEFAINNALIIADNPKDFAEKTVEVYTNKDLWEQMSKNCHLIIEKYFLPEHAVRVLGKVLQTLT